MALGQTQSSPVPSKPFTPDGETRRIPHTGPKTWTIVEERPHLVRPGTRWHVYIEETESGTAVSGNRQTPIRQTRVRITSVDLATALETDIGFIEHFSNFEIAILPPGDPRLDNKVAAATDPENPWPNQAGFHFVEGPRPFDYDEDNRNELALKYYSTHPDDRARGILLIQADESGVPTELSLSSFVATIATKDLRLRDITWPEKQRNSILHVSNRSLKDCHFMALLEIRGALNCDDCCDFSILLRRSEEGKYVPFYERESQYPLLDRLRTDIVMISSGDQLPLIAAEEAALARMASFLYLTGQGDRTDEELDKALGVRADNYKVQLLRDRIDSHFLAR